MKNWLFAFLAVCLLTHFRQQGAIIECVKIGKPAVPVLLKALKDPGVKWEAKLRIGWALSDIFKEKKNCDPMFLDELEKVAQIPDFFTSDQAVRALTEFRHPRAVEILKKLIENHPDEHIRGGSTFADPSPASRIKTVNITFEAGVCDDPPLNGPLPRRPA